MIYQFYIISYFFSFFLIFLIEIYIYLIYNKYIRYFYNLLIKRRVINNCSLLGNIYFEKTYIIKTNNIKANVTSFIKKKGTN
jgi:hypothetical protein